MDGAARQHDVCGHAVVLGASLAGLATAAALASRCERVTVIERDLLPPTGEHRKSVPQGRHAHLLLPSGLTTLGQLLPGFCDDLLSHGAHIIGAAEFRFYLGAGRLALDRADLAITGATRPLIEGVARRRVRELPNVEFAERSQAIGLITDSSRTCVTGVRLLSSSGAGDCELAADLVVDATGRSSRTPRWLTELGYPAPAGERLAVGVHYSTRLFHRDPADLGGCRHVVVTIPPGGRHGGLAMAVEGDRWLVTLVGSHDVRPPTDLDGFARYAAGLWREDLHEVVTGADPVGEPFTGAFPAYLRRRYDRLRRFPGHYVVIGDALCSLSPVYAQGMSVAIREAELLGRVLDDGGPGRAGQRFFRRARPLVDDAWTLSTGADLADPALAGARTPAWRLVNAYTRRLVPLACQDPVVANAFFEVSSLIAPPSHLMHPRVLRRVLRRGRAGATGQGTETAGQPVIA